jgi:short-subunit dehydrogenase
MMSEQQRTAIVTGAAGGIGRELVLGLLGKGLKVAAVDRTAQGLAELAQAAQQRQQGANLMTIEADLARDESIDEIVSTFSSTTPVSARRRSAAITGSARSNSGR